ncbi:MAG: phage tail protein, partial [Bryobacteraceae bacterium]
MATISALKEQRTTQTPLFLVECELASGSVERWSTHSVTVEGSSYEGRIIRHNLFEIRAEADDGVDGVPKISLTLVNTDSYCSQIERNTGWKGAKVTVRFVFYDLKNGAAASEQSVIFKGIANPPDEITESSMRLTVSNRMNLQRLLLPQVRIQRRCPWKFPATADQRMEGVSGADDGKYSPFYACGYSPSTSGGVGNLNGTECYTTCDYSRTSCEARGMFNKDSAGSNTRRFGGIEYVPSTILVRSYGDKSYHLSAVTENESRYNDCVPVVYGTAWYKPPIVFARNDGNLTRFEVLLGMGKIYGVLKVLVKQYEIAAGVDGTDMTATGWYKLFNAGERTGDFNYDFTDSNGNPSGDPYGSMAVLSVVVPNSINDGDTLPTIEVLLQGMLLPRYDASGNALGESFSNNPAWVMLDILRRIGWSLDEIDLPSFADTAAYCEEMIDGQDIYGNALQIPRFQCNAVLRSRKCAADVIRGIRTGSRLQLTLGTDGLLRLRVENSLKLQQPTKPDGSNGVETLNDGWPCYEFDDGTSGFGGILRNSSGEPSISLSARNTADTPNRYSVEFQDALNEYQQDSLSLVDVDDAVRVRQEISATLQATGIPNFHQAARIIQLQLDKSVRGNLYVEFDTSVRGVHLKPGDIITVTYLREGLERQPFRITGITPGQNYGTATIEAQIHDDAWYTDELGSTTGTGGRRRAGSEVGIPRPLVGSVLDENGEAQFEVTESTSDDSEGQSTVTLTAGFIAPAKPVSTDLSIPMLDMSPLADDNRGTLAGDQTLYYAVSALGADGAESALSFVVTAVIPPGTATNSVRLTGLRFGPEATGFCVYRGTNPSLLFLIASSSELASEFTDSGLTKQLVSPPDESYDHANFYWRRELVPEAPATVHSTETIGNDALQMTENAYRGMTVRIFRGTGSGQERSVASNSATVLTVSSAWSVEPDTSSYFVVAESSW